VRRAACWRCGPGARQPPVQVWLTGTDPRARSITGPRPLPGREQQPVAQALASRTASGREQVGRIARDGAGSLLMKASRLEVSNLCAMHHFCADEAPACHHRNDHDADQTIMSRPNPGFSGPPAARGEALGRGAFVFRSQAAYTAPQARTVRNCWQRVFSERELARASWRMRPGSCCNTRWAPAWPYSRI